MESILLLSLATASIAFTVSETVLLEQLRSVARRRSPILGAFITCGYCVGQWVAFGLVAIYQPRLFVCWRPLDYVVTSLIVAWLATFQWIVASRLVRLCGK